MKVESSSRSITDDAPPLSIFVLLYQVRRSTNYDKDLIIQRLEPQQQQHSNDDDDDDRNKQVVCFKIPQVPRKSKWCFALPTCSTGALYLFPCWSTDDTAFHAYNFDFRTGELGKINLPQSKLGGYAVNLGGRIYFLEPRSTKSVFECYHPTLATWKALKPFPDPPSECRVNATAVWGDDTILFNTVYLSRDATFLWNGVESRCIWAYSVPQDKWYVVDVEDDDCYRIFGEAVILNGTIYALTDLASNIVLALSFEMKHKDDGNLVFECSLQSKILVTGFELVLPMEKAWTRNRHMVHLDKYNFCIVDSCEPKNYRGNQPIQLSYIRLDGDKMNMFDSCVHELEIKPRERFYTLKCFLLPKGMTTALEGKNSVFVLDPFTPKQDKGDSGEGISASTNSFMSGQDKGDSGEGTSASTTEQDKADGEGHSLIYLRNVPRNATAQQLEKLKKFGPIKEEGIGIWKNKKGDCFAYVEFESATSKQRAIEAATIKIGHLTAEILEKPPRSLVGQAVPFGKN